eukprot:m51a1_g13316 hypothetical protein (148) ;mRNA; f:1816-2353
MSPLPLCLLLSVCCCAARAAAPAEGCDPVLGYSYSLRFGAISAWFVSYTAEPTRVGLASAATHSGTMQSYLGGLTVAEGRLELLSGWPFLQTAIRAPARHSLYRWHHALGQQPAEPLLSTRLTAERAGQARGAPGPGARRGCSSTGG